MDLGRTTIARFFRSRRFFGLLLLAWIAVHSAPSFSDGDRDCLSSAEQLNPNSSSEGIYPADPAFYTSRTKTGTGSPIAIAVSLDPAPDTHLSGSFAERPKSDLNSNRTEQAQLDDLETEVSEAPPLKAVFPPHQPDALKRSAELALGRLGYHNIVMLGEGGMGIVVKATDASGNHRAFKFLSLTEPRAIAAFEAEAKVMNHLAQVDPAFLPAKRITFRLDNGKLLEAMEMEYLPGEPLIDHIRAGGLERHPQNKAKISNEIHRLIALAHEHGVWHQDLKPRNIMVTLDQSGNPQVRLIDFGLAIHAPAHGGTGPVLPILRGSFQGTYGYIPDWKVLGAPSSERDDVYSMRVIDWQIRLGDQSTDGKVLVRSAAPKPLPFDSSETLVGSLDAPFADPPQKVTADESKNWTDPARALDDSGPLEQRILAMAEWSQIPRTPKERDQLLHDAKTQNPADFLREHGKRLISRDSQTDLFRSYTRNSEVREILGSTVLIENLHPDRGLQIPAAKIEEIARHAAEFYLDTRAYAKNPESLGQLGNNYLLYFREMKKQVDELHAQGVLSQDWNGFERQVIKGRWPWR